MNPEQLLTEVENAVKNRPDSPYKRYWLYRSGDKIVCEPIRPREKADVVLGQFGQTELEKGFTLRQWSQILA